MTQIQILKVGPRTEKVIEKIEIALRWGSKAAGVDFTIENKSHHHTQRGIRYLMFHIQWESDDREKDLDCLFPHLQTMWPNLVREALTA